ncbi:hypothetical protein BD309DRAFT_516321 [Dichomitus squalens]|uniref:Uncharacterized protein n=1 Tax=Dichomitus squalens TaxID=114155 RepID=A0A4Q9M6C3_9APHY|nr:hypothetical protein BD311DRAFT_180173 [Dichomitus squalens]TBU38517.1 hypothetical protein BD309DRAFT_516321 [Dichomitus squalens]
MSHPSSAIYLSSSDRSLTMDRASGSNKGIMRPPGYLDSSTASFDATCHVASPQSHRLLPRRQSEISPSSAFVTLPLCHAACGPSRYHLL